MRIEAIGGGFGVAAFDAVLLQLGDERFEASVGRDETLLAQIGTSESTGGRLVVRMVLRAPPLG